jgi:lipopolysaccharide export system protein LptA
MMTKLSYALVLAALFAAPVCAAPAQPAKPAAKSTGGGGPALGGLGGLGSSSKEPIKIDSDRLDVFDKDKKAIFSGNVVAVQGETTMRCTTLTVFYEQSAAGQQKGAAPAKPGEAKPAAADAKGAGGTADNGVRRLECSGPVTVISKDQVATADNAVYDKGDNKVYLNGNAKLSQGPNVTTGSQVVYDLNTSQATVQVKPGERVRALLVPGSEQPQTGQPKGKKPEGRGTASN